MLLATLLSALARGLRERRSRRSPGGLKCHLFDVFHCCYLLLPKKELNTRNQQVHTTPRLLAVCQLIFLEPFKVNDHISFCSIPWPGQKLEQKQLGLWSAPQATSPWLKGHHCAESLSARRPFVLSGSVHWCRLRSSPSQLEGTEKAMKEMNSKHGIFRDCSTDFRKLAELVISAAVAL